MKIAIFTDTYSPDFNGIVTSIKNFTERMAKRGHQIYIFCPRYDKKHDPRIENIKIYRYPAFSFATNKNTKIALPSFLRLVSEVRRIKPDLIHAQTPMNMGVSGIMVAKILGIPSIQTYHTYIPDFLVYLSPRRLLGIDEFYQQIKDSKMFRYIYGSESFQTLLKAEDEVKESEIVQSLEHAVSRPRRIKRVKLSERFAWDFTRFLYGRSELVLAPSFALVESLRQHKVKTELDAQSNGIEYDYFLKKKNYNIHHKIVHVGRLGLEKDVDVVIRAMGELVPDYPKLHLDILGDGPAMDALISLTKELKLEKNISFLGYIPRTEIRSRLRAYDFFVTASAIETQGLVILEAMAAGLPAIGVKKLAVPEIIINDKSGYLAKPKNYKSLAEKMRLLLTSKQKNQRLAQGALEVALSHNIFGEVERLEYHYQEVVFQHLNKERD